MNSIYKEVFQKSSATIYGEGNHIITNNNCLLWLNTIKVHPYDSEIKRYQNINSSAFTYLPQFINIKKINN